MTFAEVVFVVRELIAVLGPWGTVALLTAIGVLIGTWYVDRFESDLLSAVGDSDEAGTGDGTETRDTEEREPADGEQTRAVDAEATAGETGVSKPEPVDVAFAELADVFAVVTDPDFSPPGFGEEPTELVFDGLTSAVSAAPEPVVTPIVTPTTLSFDERTAAVSKSVDPVVTPVRVPADLSFDERTAAVSKSVDPVVTPVQTPAELSFGGLSDAVSAASEPVVTPVVIPTDLSFDGLTDAVSAVSEPAVTPIEGPTELSFDGLTAVVSRCADPVVTPVPVPAELAFDDLTNAVSAVSEPVVEPVEPPVSAAVDEPWDVSADEGVDRTEIELAASPSLFSGESETSPSIDDQWEVGSDVDASAAEGRGRTAGVVTAPDGADEQRERGQNEAATESEEAAADRVDEGEPTTADGADDSESDSTALLGEGSSVPRRKLLGALATIGGAAAFGGSGTSAFFGDREELANNQLVAGDLDLKVDWTEHYSDWSDDEAEGIDVSMEPGEGLVGFPSTAPEDQQSVFVDEGDVQQFLDNTAIEAFPDADPTLDPDAVDQDDYDALQTPFANDSDICDLDADLDDALSHPYRTQGTFGGGENPQETSEGDPLVSIMDLKPGDFGEVTFSFHLCGNPGYIWLTGALRSAAENEVTDPEGESPAEESGVVELLDAIQVALWYDTGPNGVYEPDVADKEDGEGDNFFGPGEQLIPLRGSLRNVLSMLESGMFPLDAEPLSQAVGGGEVGDGTAETVGDLDDDPTPTIYNSTEDEPFASDNPSGNAPPENFDCGDYQRLLDDVGRLVGATAREADELLEAGMSFSACGGSVIIDDLDVEGGSITVSTSFPVRVFSVKGGREGENIYVWPEPVFLDEVELTTPTGQAISNVDVCCTVGGGGGGGQGDPDRQCFENSTTAYVGFEWWIPMDVGNEIQTDSISFDLGFYTEQCRHNDGSGMANRGG